MAHIESDLVRDYAAIRKRLYAAPPVKAKPVAPTIYHKPAIAWRVPLAAPLPLRELLPPSFVPFLNGAPLGLMDILRAVAYAHQLTVNDLQSSARHKHIIVARHQYFYRAATETTASYVQIGMRCGKMDHTTVMHGIKSHCTRLGLPFPRGLRPLSAARKPRQSVQQIEGQS